MADEIYQNNYVGDQAAWHGKGTVMDGQFYARDVVEKGGFDYTVVKIPLYTQDGQAVDRFATVRNDLPIGDPDRILGVVGPRYEVVQNADAFTFFDNVVGEGQAIYTSAGVLGHGERTFIVARIPMEFYVVDDKFEEYVVLNNSHDGSYALRIMTTAVRVVCQNTLSAALRSFKSKVSLRHTTNVHSRMLDAAELLGLVDKKFRETQELFNHLVQKPLTHLLFEQFVEELFPAENPNRRTSEHRDGVKALFAHEWNQTLGIRHTAYSAFQACVQYVDHVMPYRHGATRFEHALFGPGVKVKDRAVKIATKLAG